MLDSLGLQPHGPFCYMFPYHVAGRCEGLKIQACLTAALWEESFEGLTLWAALLTQVCPARGKISPHSLQVLKRASISCLLISLGRRNPAVNL